MTLSIRQLFVAAVSLTACLLFSQVMLESYAEARAGGGRSSGSRGSRSYQAPARQAPANQPRREAAAPVQPAPQPSPMTPQPSFMRSFGTALVGGFLGSMLFSGLAHAGLGGFGGSGFGMIELLLIAGIAYFAFRMFRNRAAMAGNNGMQYQSTDYQPTSNASYGSTGSVEAAQAPSSDQIDYRSLTMMDHNFTPEQFVKNAQNIFFKVQGAWNKQDVATLRTLCGSELMQGWEKELSDQRARGQQNKMENIALRESDITEAWTENGEDYITVRWLANLLDYTVDAKSGSVINGSDSEPVQFEEYWTFSRPVGPNAWKLSAVQQA